MKKNGMGKMAAAVISTVVLFNLFATNVFAYWSTSTVYASKSISISSGTQSQTAAVTLPSGSTAYSVTADNGSASFSQSGDTVTVNVSGAKGTTSSSQVWNATKYSKTAGATVGPQASQTFSQTYSYNDGAYSGTLSQSGSAILVSGLPPDSKSATYDYTCRYNATATITSIQNGMNYFSWNYPSVASSYSYSDAGGYSGNIPFTGYGNATDVESHFDFASPNYVGETGQGYAIAVFHYAGIVTRPDTRQWEMNYSGTVYEGGYDTVTTTVYNYNITVNYYTVTSTWISDTTPPDGNATLTPSGITSGNVTINFTATDGGSGVKSITLPDGSVVNGSSAGYTATANGTYSFVAADNDGNTRTFPVTVSNIDRTITVTHPVSVSFAIDPNSGAPFTAPDIPITNDSEIPVKVSIQSLTASAGDSLQFTDVSPAKYSDWSRLTAAQTQSDIALGVGVRETATGSDTWSEIDRAVPIYAADVTGKTLLGILNPNGAVGTLELTAKYGLAWDQAYTSVHSLTLLFELTN